MINFLKKILDEVKIKYWLRFIVNAILLFITFIVFYFILREIEYVDVLYVDGLNLFAKLLLFLSEQFTELFGYEVVTYGKTIRIIDDFRASGIHLDRGCMGRNVLIGYAGLILATPGMFYKKLWYIPMGMTILTFINVLRISGLAITAYCCPQYSDVNHYFIFKTFAWAAIFILWTIWFNKFVLKAGLNAKKKD